LAPSSDWKQRGVEVNHPDNVQTVENVMALIFDNFFDSTVTSSANSAAFQAAVNAVENFLTSQLTTFGANSDVTLRINWRFATTDYKGNAFGPNTLANNVF
jgi:hypothetical protein